MQDHENNKQIVQIVQDNTGLYKNKLDYKGPQRAMKDQKEHNDTEPKKTKQDNMILLLKKEAI